MTGFPPLGIDLVGTFAAPLRHLSRSCLKAAIPAVYLLARLKIVLEFNPLLTDINHFCLILQANLSCVCEGSLAVEGRPFFPMHLSATLSRAGEKSQGRDYERSQRCHLCEIDREKMWRCEVQKFPFSDDQLLLALGNWATLINIEDLSLFLLLGSKLEVQAEGKFEG